MNWALAVVEAAGHTSWWPETWAGRVWMAFGFCAQAAFSARFLVQWIASERRGRSYVPVSFWYLSLLGGVMLLTYAVHRRDPVFAIGQLAGCVIYVRNLMLLHGRRSRATARREQVTSHDIN